MTTPFLVALTAILRQLEHTLGMVTWGHVVRPTLAVLAAVALLAGLLRLRLGEPRRAGLLATAGVTLFFWHGPLRATFVALTDWGLAPGVAGALTGVVWCLPPLGAGAWLLRRPREDPAVKALADFAFMFSLVLLVLDAGAVLRRALTLDAAPLPLAGAPVDPGRALAGAPDIYWIVLDAYARQDVLRDSYGVDNRPFLDGLRARGFQVAPAASSNYATTTISMASALNLDYLRPDPDHPVERSADYYAPLASMIRRARLTRILAAHGYRTVCLSSGYFAFDHGAFEVSKPSRLSSFENLLLQTTLAGEFSRGVQRWARREDSLEVLRRLPGETVADRPSFVVAHVNLPHLPFVLGADGEPADPGFPRYSVLDYGGVLDWHMGKGWYRAAYAAQVQGVNLRVMRALEGILARPGRGSVILLMGDHGPASRRTSDPHTEDLRERFAILMALRFPGDSVPALPPTLSPVNVGRLLLRRVFGAGHALLPDRTFYSAPVTGFGLQELPPALVRPAEAPSPAPSPGA